MAKTILLEIYGKGVIRATDATKKQNEPTPYALEALAGYLKAKDPENQVNIIQQRPFKKKDLGLPYEKEDEEIYIDDNAILEIAKEIASTAKEGEPVIVAIREVAPTHVRAMEVSQMLKKAIPGIKIIVGGYHVSEAITEIFKGDIYKASEKDVRKTTGGQENLFDCIAVGEGEETLFQTIRAFGKNPVNNSEALEGIEGAAYFNNEKSEGVFNGRRERLGKEGRLSLPPAYRFLTTNIKDKDGKFIERASSIGSTQYFTYPEGKNIRMMQVAYHRGCAGCGDSPCSFCSSPNVTGKDVTFRDPKEVVGEILSCYHDPNMKANYVYFPDLTFNGNMSEFEGLLDEMEKHKEFGGDSPENIHWFCLSKPFNIRDIESVDAELLKTSSQDGIERIREIFQRMQKLGCSKIGLGVEGFTPEAMLNLKRSSVDKADDYEKSIEMAANAILSLKLASEAGMITRSFFLLGTEDQGKKFKEFSKALLSLEIPNETSKDLSKVKDVIKNIYAFYEAEGMIDEKDGHEEIIKKLNEHLGFSPDLEKGRLFEIDHLRLAPITPYYSTDTGREKKLRIPDYYRDDGESGSQKYLRDANNQLIPRLKFSESNQEIEMRADSAGKVIYGIVDGENFRALLQEELKNTKIKIFEHPNFPDGLTLKEAIDAGMDWITELLDQDNPTLESKLELGELTSFAKKELIAHHYGNEAFKKSVQEKTKKFPHLKGSYHEWMSKVNKSLFKEGQEGFDWFSEIKKEQEKEQEKEIKPTTMEFPSQKMK